MSEEPMKGFSTPGDQVRGPQDLVARMNTATSENWETVPFPARQQLGWHDRLGVMTINDYTGKGPEELVHAPEQAGDGDLAKLSSFVDYHLEHTAPPAEPAGAPGSSGYNNMQRNVPAAKGFENPSDHEVTQTAGGRVVQFAPDQGLSPEEQAKVDGVGPFVPSPVTNFAGAGDDRVEDRDLPKYGTANGVRHGDAESFDPQGKANATEASNVATGAVAPAGPSAVQEPTTGTGGGSEKVQAAQPAAAPPQPQNAASEVPEGSIDKVLAWVGDDKDRAQQALETEQAKPEPRRSLIAHLNDKIQ